MEFYLNTQRLLSFTLIILIIAIVMTPTQSQVTFSRDWNAGKRMSIEHPSAECNAILRSISSLCNMVSKNIHHLTVCQSKSFLHDLQQNDDVSGEQGNLNGNTLFSTNSRL